MIDYLTAQEASGAAAESGGSVASESINGYSYSYDKTAQQEAAGKCGYRRLARGFNLPRDTVRGLCLNPKLHSATEMAKKTKTNDDKGLEYYKTAALFWETYARNLE